jgi:hypothetical protein
MELKTSAKLILDDRISAYWGRWSPSTPLTAVAELLAQGFRQVYSIEQAAAPISAPNVSTIPC